MWGRMVHGAYNLDNVLNGTQRTLGETVDSGIKTKKTHVLNGSRQYAVLSRVRAAMTLPPPRTPRTRQHRLSSAHR